MTKKYLPIAFFLLIGIFFLWSIYLPKEVYSKEEVVFKIEKGHGSDDISRNLQNNGLISWWPAFRIYVLVTGSARTLQAGEYKLSPSMTVPQIAKMIVEGDVIKEKITIIEGWNLKEISSYFKEKGLAADVFPSISHFSANYAFLRELPENASLEGYLFPDTYEIQKKDTVNDAINLMLDNFDKKLTPDMRKTIADQNKSIFQIIVMASLLEKEVASNDDKEMVSGVLWKRLAAGMSLQVDATISYIIDRKSSQISIADTKIDSPYNTYMYKGLPIGPIANPGIESIKAAIEPKSNPYWYYLSTPEGETIFSRTLQEHNIAKAKYLKP